MANAMAEKEIQRLRRLPENRICPNCCRKDTAFGFSAVCVAYKTFVCSDCKSAHQAFSHRCKSVSMSNWTMVEVQALDEKNGGGNRAATRKWLASVPESVRPAPDSHIDVKKAFITRAYDKGEWVNSSSDIINNGAASASSKAAAPQQNQAVVQKQAPVAKPSNSKRPDVTNVNLLDDDSFAAQGSQPQAPTSTQVANAPARAECNLLDDSFFTAPTPSSSVVASNEQASSIGGFDPLLGSSVVQKSVAPSSESAFSFISQPPVQVSTNQPNSNGFDFVNSGGAPSTGILNQATIGQATETSAFSFISAAQSSQPSCHGSFDPLASIGSPAPQLLQPPAQPGNFAQGYGMAPGMFPQQPMGVPGGYAPCQMNPYAQQWGGPLGQPTMPSYPTGNQMNLGGLQMSTGMGSHSSVGNSAALAPTTPQSSKPQSQSKEASSFDPFDPFAPRPISVCA